MTMEKRSREEVLVLLEQVISLRQTQPKVLQESYLKSTLSMLKKVEFEEDNSRKAAYIDIPSLTTVPDLDVFDEIEEIKEKIKDQTHNLHILSKKKKCKVSNVFHEPRDATS